MMFTLKRFAMLPERVRWSEMEVDLESGVKPGVESLEPVGSHGTRTSPAPLTSSRPERLLSPERVLWTEVSANGHSRHPTRG
jgi:hypothetical protein